MFETSDIDYLVVVNDLLTLHEKQQMIQFILDIKEKCPPKGLEMSVIQKNVLNPFIYPTPFELHYSSMHLPSCEKDLTSFCEKMHGVDKDLAVHCMLTYQKGITVYGVKRENVFSLVPLHYYIDSVYNDISHSIHCMNNDQRSFVLNLCRTLYFIEHKEIISKRQGGLWALKSLPYCYHDMIQKAIHFQVINQLILNDFYNYSMDIVHRFLEETCYNT